MNQHQRKFLLEQIEGLYRVEKVKLQGRCPKEPSLNNYLVASILDGSARLRSLDLVQKEVRQIVRSLGKGEVFVTSSSKGWGAEDSKEMVAIPALTLFEPPAGYGEAMAAYNRERAEWERDREALENGVRAMKIKVQVGSDEALSALVDQADKLCNMSLADSSALLLPSSTGKANQ